MAVYSPEYRIQFTGDPDEALPDIRRWSDFAWEEWVHFCNEASPPVEPGSLKFVLHDDVENDDTKDIANLVLQNEGKQLSTWPGLELDVARSDNGKAMAYTPNSRAFLHLPRARSLTGPQAVSGGSSSSIGVRSGNASRSSTGSRSMKLNGRRLS